MLEVVSVRTIVCRLDSCWVVELLRARRRGGEQTPPPERFSWSSIAGVDGFSAWQLRRRRRAREEAASVPRLAAAKLALAALGATGGRKTATPGGVARKIWTRTTSPTTFLRLEPAQHTLFATPATSESWGRRTQLIRVHTELNDGHRRLRRLSFFASAGWLLGATNRTSA